MNLYFWLLVNRKFFHTFRVTWLTGEHGTRKIHPWKRRNIDPKHQFWDSSRWFSVVYLSISYYVHINWVWPPHSNSDHQDYSGQIITTSAEVTLNGGLLRESTQNPLNSGLGIILICPDYYIFSRGSPHKPSFPTVTGRGDNPNYMHINIHPGQILSAWIEFGFLGRPKNTRLKVAVDSWKVSLQTWTSGLFPTEIKS